MRNTIDESNLHPAIREKIAGYQAQIVARVKQLIENHEVVVVGMSLNPFPAKARRLLDRSGIPYEYLGIGSYFGGFRTRLGLKLWTGWPTFPMIFVKGTLIGGFDDLRRLIETGEMKNLLQAER